MGDPKFRPSGRRSKRAVALRSDWALTDFDEAIQQGLPADYIRQAMRVVAPGTPPRGIVARAQQLFDREQARNGRMLPPARAAPAPVKLRLFRPKDPEPDGEEVGAA